MTSALNLSLSTSCVWTYWRTTLWLWWSAPCWTSCPNCLHQSGRRSLPHKWTEADFLKIRCSHQRKRLLPHCSADIQYMWPLCKNCFDKVKNRIYYLSPFDWDVFALFSALLWRTLTWSYCYMWVEVCLTCPLFFKAGFKCMLSETLLNHQLLQFKPAHSFFFRWIGIKSFSITEAHYFRWIVPLKPINHYWLEFAHYVVKLKLK